MMKGNRAGAARWVVAVVTLIGVAGVTRAAPPAAPVDAPGSRMDFSAPGNRLAYAAGVADPAAGSGVVQASGCASCGTAGGYPTGPGIWGYGKHGGFGPGCGPDGCGEAGCGAGCGENGCVPGRPPCCTCEGRNHVERFFCAFHNALCCPDPCYEPRWIPAANAALFVDYARPATLTRLRWDSGRNLIQPDRSEYFWAGQGRKGPGTLTGGRVVNPETGVNYNELNLYQEVATGRFSFWINMPYRNLNGDVTGGHGGFGDLSLGTKTVLLDSELMVWTFQFATYIPTGNPSTGIGVGHVSLEPSILGYVKLYPDTYWQTQLSYWIPISPTSTDVGQFAGGVLHYHNSLNHVIWRPLADTCLIGTLEAVGYTFTAGRVTDPATGFTSSANNQTYFSVGPGLRWSICDKLDVGFGMQFAVTNPHFSDQLYRTELRWRY